jgi:hypothetical protein
MSGTKPRGGGQRRERVHGSRVTAPAFDISRRLAFLRDVPFISQPSSLDCQRIWMGRWGHKPKDPLLREQYVRRHSASLEWDGRLTTQAAEPECC